MTYKHAPSERIESFVVVEASELSGQSRADFARKVTEALIDLASELTVDGFSDVKELPLEAATSLEIIQGHAPLIRRILTGSRQTFMGIPIEPKNVQLTEAFMTFAPYSIHAEVLNADGSELLVLHDASSSITMHIPATRVSTIQSVLPPGTSLFPIKS